LRVMRPYLIIKRRIAEETIKILEAEL